MAMTMPMMTMVTMMTTTTMVDRSRAAALKRNGAQQLLLALHLTSPLIILIMVWRIYLLVNPPGFGHHHHVGIHFFNFLSDETDTFYHYILSPMQLN